MEQTTTFAGFFNYLKNGLPMTKMVTEIENSNETVVSLLQEHSDVHGTSLASYHISVYINDAKVGQTSLSNFKF